MPGMTSAQLPQNRSIDSSRDRSRAIGARRSTPWFLCRLAVVYCVLSGRCASTAPSVAAFMPLPMKRTSRRVAAVAPSRQTVAEPSLYWPTPASASTNTNTNSNSNSNSDPRQFYGDDDLDYEYDEQGVPFDSIIKIYCTHNEPNFLMPWQKQQQSTSTSSGFVIEGRQIMTNAHAVEYASIIQVQRRGQPDKFRATLKVIGNDCDLAVLTVDKPEFWHDENGGFDDADILPFSPELPYLQEEVDVLGYPTGGDSMSVTSGIVSRIEMQEYTQSGTFLLAIQVDAAINPGNSGGPVVNTDGEIIGVAFQGLDSAENIGYVVPVTVARYFLDNIRKNNGTQFTGFCRLGVNLNMLENESFRKSLGMGKSSGVMVRSLSPTSRAAELDPNLMRRNDVITRLDGIPVSNDGKIPFRGTGERVSMNCYVQTKFDRETVRLDVLRDGKTCQVDVPATPSLRLVPGHWDNKPPPYMVVGGLVFTVLSLPYLDASRAWSDYVSDSMSYLVSRSSSATLKRHGQQIVILTQVLAHSNNLGYEHLADLQLSKVDGVKIHSLKHLHKVLNMDTDSDGNSDNSGGDQKDAKEFVTFEFQPTGQLVVLDRANLRRSTKEVCEENFIQKPIYLHDDDDGGVGAASGDVASDGDGSEVEGSGDAA